MSIVANWLTECRIITSEASQHRPAKAGASCCAHSHWAAGGSEIPTTNHPPPVPASLNNSNRSIQFNSIQFNSIRSFSSCFLASLLPFASLHPSFLLAWGFDDVKPRKREEERAQEKTRNGGGGEDTVERELWKKGKKKKSTRKEDGRTIKCLNWIENGYSIGWLSNGWVSGGVMRIYERCGGKWLTRVTAQAAEDVFPRSTFGFVHRK